MRKRENRPTTAADDTSISIIQSSTANNLMVGEIINRKTGAVCCKFRAFGLCSSYYKNNKYIWKIMRRFRLTTIL